MLGVTRTLRWDQLDSYKGSNQRQVWFPIASSSGFECLTCMMAKCGTWTLTQIFWLQIRSGNFLGLEVTTIGLPSVGLEGVARAMVGLQLYGIQTISYNTNGYSTIGVCKNLYKI